MKKLWFTFIAIFIFSFAKMIGDTVFAVGIIAFVSTGCLSSQSCKSCLTLLG